MICKDISYDLHTIIGDSRFNRSRDMITSVEIENGSSCDPDHASLRAALSTESSDLI